jgi:acyl-CoA hydrolase
MVGNSSLKVKVEIFVEQMHSDERELAVVGEFNMVAINDLKQPEAIRLN